MAAVLSDREAELIDGEAPLSVVIVTWNGMRHLPRCLEALAPQMPPGAELVLVDNGSTDGTRDWLHIAYPKARLVALPSNLGFAGGAAVGLRAASGELLLLLNDDAFVEPGCIAALLRAMADHPEIGAAGGVLTFDHRPELIASAGLRLRRDGLALDLLPGRPLTDLPRDPVEILGPSGALAIYRRTLLEDVGLPEAGFFAYLEDVDLAIRAALRGWRSLLVPSARARHVYSATAVQGSAFKQRLLARNRVRTIVRCFPAGTLRRCLPAILAYDLMAAAYAILRRQPAILAGRLDALRELRVLRRQRRLIQGRRAAPHAALERWLEPAPPPWKTLGEQRALDAILRERSPGA